jgi:hypothetical protein
VLRNVKGTMLTTASNALKHGVAVLKNNDTHRSLTKLFIFISMVFTCNVYMYTSQRKKGVDQNFII